MHEIDMVIRAKIAKYRVLTEKEPHRVLGIPAVLSVWTTRVKPRPGSSNAPCCCTLLPSKWLQLQSGCGALCG